MNPKDKYGLMKVPMELVPDTALIHTALAFGEGARKYNAYNWRTNPVKTSIYIGAARRHIAQYWNGEKLDRDSNVHNLACAIACLMILIDSEEVGNLVEDLPPKVDITSLLEKYRKVDSELLTQPMEGLEWTEPDKIEKDHEPN